MATVLKVAGSGPVRVKAEGFGSESPRCRPRTVLDLMILVAAIAVGLSLDKEYSVLGKFGLFGESG